MKNQSLDSPLLKQRVTINPYLQAGGNLLRRLTWDVNPKSWVSRNRLKSIKNKYRGQKAVIICNGPSLLDTDFSLLQKIFTFGLNKINLLFDKHEFRPSCIVSVNPYVIEQNKEFYNHTDIALYLDSVCTSLINLRNNVTFIHSNRHSVNKFARDCSISINQGGTVTYVAMQLAYHMGFSEVALIGCDHNFKSKGPANLAVVSKENDPDHFDPNYFAGGQVWQLPDLALSEMCYGIARDIYFGSGRKIVNCTSGGKLELFPRASLDKFIS